MLSNKWTFSLTSLVIMLAFCFIAPAMAQFDVTLSLGEGEDVSHADGNQVIYGTDGNYSLLPSRLCLRRW